SAGLSHSCAVPAPKSVPDESLGAWPGVYRSFLHGVSEQPPRLGDSQWHSGIAGAVSLSWLLLLFANLVGRSDQPIQQSCPGLRGDSAEPPDGAGAPAHFSRGGQI